MLGIRNYRAPDVKLLAQQLNEPAQYLLDDVALQAAVAQARDQSEFTEIESPCVQLRDRLPAIEDFERILRESPKQNALKRLVDDPALSEWVRSGLKFHEHTGVCAFCGGDATQALREYQRHFSDEYERQYTDIAAAITRLEQDKPVATFPHEREWVPNVRAKVLNAQRRYLAWKDREDQIRATWAGLLREKLTNMDLAIAVEAVEERLSTLESITAEFEELRAEHNSACNELSDMREMASKKVKEHFAARYLTDPGVAETIEALTMATALLGRVDRVAQQISATKGAANAELQRCSVAASQINDLLQRLLGSRLSVEQAEDGRLRFMREGESALNMSDGERTAISLAYFLVSLGKDGQRLEEVVVFVDDPICSLDANHIYDVAYLLMTLLKGCRQVFISTHNSEFFNTVKQDWMDHGAFKSDHAGYLVQRQNGGASQLLKLPRHLEKFRSDYHHVFYCLRRIQASESTEVDAYLHCPNLLRRFLEMYLGFRKPAPSGYQVKLYLLIDDEIVRKAVARYVDEGSHSASTLRLLEFSDFPAMSRGMVDRVMDALANKDPEHYHALMEATE